MIPISNWGNMKVRPVVFAATSLVLLLTACTPDPYPNAGECTSVGESRTLDGTTQVCIIKSPDSEFHAYEYGEYY